MSSYNGPELTHQDYEIISEKEAYSGYCAVRHLNLRFRLFQGGWSQVVFRDLIVRTNASAVLLYDPEKDSVVLIEQFRTGALEDAETPWLLEIVAGLIDDKDTPENAAYREAKEEAGCDILKLKHICTYRVSPGISNEVTYVYFGIVNAPENPGIHGLNDEGENIKVHVLSSDEVINLFNQGKINSASAVIALQWFILNRASLREFP